MPHVIKFTAAFFIVDMEKKKNIDWEKIELDYRAGIKTLRDIGDEHAISHAAIAKRARRDGWTRDLSAKIKAKAEYLVSKSLVTTEVTKEKRIAESEIVEANALKVSEVDLSHRCLTSVSREVLESLLKELKDQIEGREDYEKLGEMMRKPDQYGNDKLNDQYLKIVSFAGRVDSFKKIADSEKIIIDLERKVYKLEENEGMVVRDIKEIVLRPL
jgi:hypothetical protein